MTLAYRTNQIQPSQTMAVTAMVDSLRREGKKVIDLGAGEPDFDTPDVIKEAAIRAIHEGYTRYTPASGALELKQAICEKYAREAQVQYLPSEILITCGAKHAVVNALLALCQDGDEVIIPAPYWTSYLEQVRFVGAQPVLVETDEAADFKMNARQLRQAVTSRTKMLILNSPGNPTGAVYGNSELADLVAVINEYDFYVIYDEIYEKIIYDGEEHVSLISFPEIRDRVIAVNGVSKSYAMTGWRIGYMAAKEEIIRACAKIQSHTTSNPCSISQRASIAALNSDASILTEMVQAFDARRKYLAEKLSGLPGIRCSLPKGAFYMFPNISDYHGARYNGKEIGNAIDFCSFLLEEAGVALVPGEAFGSSKHVRLSYATSMANLQEAVARIEPALNKLKHGS